MKKSISQKDLFSGDHTIYWPEKYESVVEYLKHGSINSKNTILYKHNVHVIVLAACIGMSSNERIERQSKEKFLEIPLSVFHNNDLSSFIYLIALNSSEEPNINLLKDIEGEKHAIKIFEQYVNGGLMILFEKYKKNVSEPPFLFVQDLAGIGQISNLADELKPTEIKLDIF